MFDSEEIKLLRDLIDNTNGNGGLAGNERNCGNLAHLSNA